MLQFRKCFTQRTQSIQRRKGFFHATPQRRNAAREISYDVVNVSIPELSHATTQRRGVFIYRRVAEFRSVRREKHLHPAKFMQ